MTQRFSVATGNIGLTEYMFMWGNYCGLNDEGVKFIENLQSKMNTLKAEGKLREATILGQTTVKSALRDGSYIRLVSSPEREQKIQQTMRQLFKDRKNCVVALQELGPNAAKIVLPENGLMSHSSMFGLSLSAADRDIESKLTRGNGLIMSKNRALTQIGSFTIEYDRSTSEKTQTRKMPCAVYAIDSDHLEHSDHNNEDNVNFVKVCVCSVHNMGYNSQGYKSITVPKDETSENAKKRLDSLEKYKIDVLNGDEELRHYMKYAELTANAFGADVIVLAGDFNQCGNTDDFVHISGLQSRKRLLEEFGFMEDLSAHETTTFDPLNPKHFPRRLDRVFFKNLTKKYRVTLKTRLISPPDDITFEELSDHALFVVGDFEFSKD